MCFLKHGTNTLKSSLIIESLHNFYNECEVSYWTTHFINKVSSNQLTKTADNSTVNIPKLIGRAFRSPTMVISTVELSDCSLSLLLHKSHHSSREPLCDVVIASVELSCQCLEPEDCNGSDHRAIRLDACVF